MSNFEEMYRFSDQAIAALMMALQRSLMEQSDIVPVLKSFDVLLHKEKGELFIKNPGIIRMSPEGVFDSEEEGEEVA